MSTFSIHNVQSMQFPFITHGMDYGAIYKRQYTDKTLTLRKFMCMRASEASELRKCRYFYIIKLLFLSICCRYIRYFVGTNDMLVGLHVPTNFQMYRQKSEKALLGGGGNFPLPPPPSGYANAEECTIFWVYIWWHTCSCVSFFPL